MIGRPGHHRDITARAILAHDRRIGHRHPPHQHEVDAAVLVGRVVLGRRPGIGGLRHRIGMQGTTGIGEARPEDPRCRGPLHCEGLPARRHRRRRPVERRGFIEIAGHEDRPLHRRHLGQQKVDRHSPGPRRPILGLGRYRRAGHMEMKAPAPSLAPSIRCGSSIGFAIASRNQWVGRGLAGQMGLKAPERRACAALRKGPRRNAAPPDHRPSRQRLTIG